MLIVDDERPSGVMLQLLLQKYDPLLTVAGITYNVAAADRFLAHEGVDLVFLDIQLKGESGFDLLDKNPSLRFRFITLSAVKDHAYKTFEYGGSGYLLKPVNREELEKVLSHVINLKPLIIK